MEGGGEILAGESDFLLPFAVDNLLRVEPWVVAQDEAGVIADIEDRAVIILDLMSFFAPRGVGEMLRTVRFRATEDEYQGLLALAKASGLSASSLIRDHLGKVEIRHRADEQKRTAMLNHINANLNQIARWVNTRKDAADAYHVMMYLLVVESEIARLCSLMEKLQ